MFLPHNRLGMDLSKPSKGVLRLRHWLYGEWLDCLVDTEGRKIGDAVSGKSGSATTIVELGVTGIKIASGRTEDLVGCAQAFRLRQGRGGY